ncbi:MAG: AAA family ATPase [Armatimonadetes bacterium]|nr:AAA family ATPase [Armatimonadota bacterium]
MNATVSLTQGPPGTGKTTTAAAGACARISARRSVGDIVLVAAQTHRAANELLQDLAAAVESAQAQALPLPPIHIAKALKGQPSSGDPRLPKGNIPLINPAAPVRDVQAHRNGGVLVIGGTTSALLEMAGNLDKSARFGGVPSGFQVPLLLVDEASMMGFPHLLALLTLLRGDGEVQVSGDHRQLAQILAQAWEREKRPPTVHYRPFLSAYDMIRAMAEKLPRAAVWLSALNHTFRLPPGIRALIAPLYAGDGIALAGDARDRQDPPTEPPAAGWEAIWGDPADVFLVVHSEAESVRSNPLEARVIEEILDAHPGAPSGSVAVVTPHCAQRSLLRRLLKGTGDARPAVDVIDTADSLQGGQRDTVIVSGTTSDPAALVTGAEFRLNPNRWNVAFTCAQSRLVVVCSESWLCHIPPEAEQYEGLALWKALPCQCARLIANQVVDGHTVRVFAG